jgi:hypothetical protein
MTKRRAMVLVLVLLSLTLVASLVMPLASMSGLEALEANSAADDLRRQMASESAVALLPQLVRDRQIGQDLDTRNAVNLSFDLGNVHVEILVQDDSAKLPLASLLSEHRDDGQARLSSLATDLRLPSPGSTSAAAASWSGCLEDLLGGLGDRELYGRPNDTAAWTHYVTPLGHNVNFRRAAPAVLRSLLADIDPELGQRLVRLRREQPKAQLDELLRGLELTDLQRRQAAERLIDQPARFSLLVRTTLAGVARQRYLICSAGPTADVLVDWEVAP